jgi:hypothetical protein
MRIMPETRATRLGEPAKRVRASSFCLAVCLVLTGVFIGWARGQSTPLTGRGLTAQDGGQVVYDANNKVYWLADANFAASAEGQKIAREMGISGVGPNGAMDYPTAQQWVKALNRYKGGWLGHDNWQLPASPMKDASCGALGPQGASFGGLCQGNPLGNLYYVGLNRMLPDNVAPGFGATVAPFENIQLSYYWTAADGGLHGKRIFSFASGSADATTIVDSYYYVLPMVPKEYGPIGGEAPHCPVGPGPHMVLYTQGPAKDKAVYDCSTGNSWPTDANLAASNPFRVTGNVEIEERRPYPRPGHPTPIKAPLISGGAMLWQTANRWVEAMREAEYLQSKYWRLPDSPDDLRTLFQSLELIPGDARLMAQGKVGPFQNLQPFFYWEECVPNLNGTGGTSPDCEAGNAPPGRAGRQMNYDFTFGYGIQGTDLYALKYFVMVCYPERR